MSTEEQLIVPIEYSINVNVTQEDPGEPAPNSSNIALLTSDTTTIEGDYGVYVTADDALKTVNADTLTAKMITALFAPSATFRNNDGKLFIIPISATKEEDRVSYTVTDGDTITAYTSVAGEASAAVAEGTQLYSDAQLTTELAVVGELDTYTYTGGTNDYTVTVPTIQSAADYIALVRELKQKVPYFGVLIDTFDFDFDMEQFFIYADTQNFVYGYGVTNYENLNLIEYKRTEGLFTGGDLANTKQSIAAFVSEGTSANWNGSDTALTMNLKSLSPILAPGKIDTTIIETLKEKGISAYALTAGDSVVYSHKNAGGYWDDKIGGIALKLEIQTNLYNLAKGVTTKIPQNESGVNMVRNAASQAWQKFLDNGFLTTGIEWMGTTTFGDKEAFLTSIVENGYYQYNKPLSQQTPAERKARKITIQGAGQSAGAIHFITYNAVLA